MATLWRDIRYSLRTLLRSRLLTLTAVLSLALAIGANTTIFSVIHAVFLKPIPVEEPARLAAVYRTFQQTPGAATQLIQTSYLNYRDLRDQATSFSGLAAFAGGGFNLAGEGQPEQVGGLYVTGNYFDTLGVKPAHGRFFAPEEDATPGTHPVVVLSHALWQRRFAADPDVVGRTIRLNAREMTVIGVAPAGFRGTNAIFSAQIWVPVMMASTLAPTQYTVAMEHRGYRYFAMVGRLAPGVSAPQAAEESRAIATRLSENHPEWNRNRGFELRGLAEARLFPGQRGIFVLAGQVLMTAVGLVLLIACANVANLLLARAGTRRKEIGMRIALGASPGRLVRELLTESLVLAGLGGAAGWVLAIWLRQVLWSLRPPFLAVDALELELGGPVFSFSLALTLATGILVGLAPAFQAMRHDLVTALKDTAGSGATRVRLRQALVTAQVALSFVSLVGAGLFLVSLGNAFAIDPGFEREKLVTLTLDPGVQGYGPEDGGVLYQRLLEEAHALPGVRSAALARSGPLGGSTVYRFFIPGKEEQVGPDGMYIPLNMVSPDYFDSMGLEIIEGRAIDEGDRRGGRSVVLVNETMAQQFWPDENPLGQQIRWLGEEHPWQVVGVVADSKYTTLGEPPSPYLYRPLTQDYASAVTLHLRTEGSPAAVMPAARQLVRELDPDLPVSDVLPIAEVLRQSLWAPSMGASLLGLFGLVALALASFGIYGVLTQVVLARRREMGIRMALGANRSQILGLTLRHGMLPVWIGVVVGAGAAVGAARLVGNLLYGLSGADLRVLVSAAAVLVAVALFACLVPARGATRLDPLTVLRVD